MIFRLGIIAILLSFVPWLALPVAALFGASATDVLGRVAVAFVVAEGLFWGGAALVGRDAIKAIKAHGWRRAPRELVRLLVRGSAARTAVR